MYRWLGVRGKGNHEVDYKSLIAAPSPVEKLAGKLCMKSIAIHSELSYWDSVGSMVPQERQPGHCQWMVRVVKPQR